MRAKRIMLSAALALGFSVSSMAGLVSSFDDIELWVGSGANQAALIIDFHDGTSSESFAWGYRWEGTACGADMMLAIAAADANLSIDSTGDGSESFLLNSVSFFSHTQTKAGDWSVFWNYYVAGGFAGDEDNMDGMVGTPTAMSNGGTSLPSSWTSAPVGASAISFGESGRILSDGAWDAWSFGAWGTAPGASVEAVPEPASALLILLGAATAAGFRRYRKHLGF